MPGCPGRAYFARRYHMLLGLTVWFGEWLTRGPGWRPLPAAGLEMLYPVYASDGTRKPLSQAGPYDGSTDDEPDPD